MRSNVALTAGMIIGATLGLACLFVLKPGEVKVSPIGAAGSQTKRNATIAKVPAPAPAAAANAGAATKSAPSMLAGRAAGATSTTAAKSADGRASGGRSTLPSMLARSTGTRSGAAAKAAVVLPGRGVASRPPVESPASARKVAAAEAPRNAIEARISGFAQGIDMRRPVSLAGGARGPAVLAMGQKPAAVTK